MDSETFEIVHWDDTSPKQPKEKKKESKTCVIVEEEKADTSSSWWATLVDKMTKSHEYMKTVMDGLVNQYTMFEASQKKRDEQIHERFDSLDTLIKRVDIEKCDHCDALQALKEGTTQGVIKDHSSEIHHILETLEHLNEQIGSYDVSDSLNTLQKQMDSIQKTINCRDKLVIPTVDIKEDATCSDTSTFSPTNGIRQILKPELYRKYLKYKAKYYKLKYGEGVN